MKERVQEFRFGSAWLTFPWNIPWRPHIAIKEQLEGEALQGPNPSLYCSQNEFPKERVCNCEGVKELKRILGSRALVTPSHRKERPQEFLYSRSHGRVKHSMYPGAF